MAARVIVMVTDLDDPKHGEITVLEDLPGSERLIETLLEAGFEQDRIRAFTGTEAEMRVAHRPVVSLDRDISNGSPESGDDSAQEEPGFDERSSDDE